MTPEKLASGLNCTYLRQITSRLSLLVIPAQAGIQGTKPPTVQLDPGLRRDDGGFGLSKCHSVLPSVLLVALDGMSYLH